MRHTVEVLLLWLMLLAGCGAVANQMAPGVPNTAVPESSPSPVAQPTGDPQRGAAIFAGDVAIAGFVACRGCHSVDPAAGDGIGPNLAGIALRAGSRMPGLRLTIISASRSWCMTIMLYQGSRQDWRAGW